MTQTMAEPKLTGAESVMWDLSILYASIDDPQIDADFARLDSMADAYAARWRGRVASLNGTEIVAAIEEEEAISDLGGRIQTYISLMFSENSADPVRGALVQRLSEVGAQLAQKMMFFDLEWKSIDDAAADAILDQVTVPKYRHALEAARRYKPHTLTEPEEQIIVEKDVTGASAWVRFYSQYTTAWTFTLTNADGSIDPTPYNQSQIFARLYEPDRDLRRRAALSITEVLRRDQMPLTYVFNTLIADKGTEDKRRGYESWISARNLSNKAPDSTVNALIHAVTSRYDICQRHYQLKRTLLGYDALYEYDRYAPLSFNGENKFHTWDEARQIVEAAYERFSPRVGEVVRRAFDENWIHAPAQPHKRGGAFSAWGTPSSHPYILMNFVGRTDDIMTLAHELGHSVHQYMGGRANGMTGLYTPLTTAEMASTFGEILTFNDLMAHETDPRTRLEMLFERTEGNFGTIFRQIAMNRFEEAIHIDRRDNGELSTERFNGHWMATQRALYADSVSLQDDYGLWWSYIPHFLHTPGYVYAYSFGELLVLSLYNLYSTQGGDFADRYVGVLEAGGTDYPDKLLAQVGVDLNDPGFWDSGLDILSGMVDQEEKLAREIFPEKFA
ncbi:MAG: M3 family oligoendopeptidase [Chloroflexota bacterium]|nr:M3 family oligoendopeptidase [Chloroflexota bacterium]